LVVICLFQVKEYSKYMEKEPSSIDEAVLFTLVIWATFKFKFSCISGELFILIIFFVFIVQMANFNFVNELGQKPPFMRNEDDGSYYFLNDAS